MGKILVTLTDETERNVREKAKERFGKRKGAISFYVEDALKHYMKIRYI